MRYKKDGTGLKGIEVGLDFVVVAGKWLCSAEWNY